jgi:hypothetical protein
MTTIAADPPIQESSPESNPLRWLTDAYAQTQKLRIAIGNRLGAVERGTDDAPLTRSVAKLYVDLQDGERAIYRDMTEALEGHPAWPWLRRVKGIGPTLGTKLIGLIGDVGDYETVSKLWRVAGYAVIDGKRERPKGASCPACGARGRAKAQPHHCPVTGETSVLVGEKLHYSVRLKTVVYLCGASFLKSGAPYRTINDQAKGRYAAREEAKPKGERWTAGHIHLAAMRVMGKLFLGHLWQTWREAQGLPVRAAYVHEVLGHQTVLDPWDFVEPAAA